MSNLPSIYGFNKTSEAGIDTFAVSIFLSGCNLRCPYCMNSRLLIKNEMPIVPIEQIKKYVEDNKSNWVMISGGEPTLSDKKELINLINEIKSWGCWVGLSTNGTRPSYLSSVIGLLNYVAMDIKGTNEISDAIDNNKYPFFSSELGYENLIKYSMEIIRSEKKNRSSLLYEFRTTLYPKFINKESIMKISKLIRKDERWVLQQFRVTKNVLLDEKVIPYTEAEVYSLYELIKETCNSEIRYV